VRRALVVLLVAAGLAGCGAGAKEPPPPPSGAEAALLARLEAKQLSVEWVRCVASGYRHASAPVFRCNVSFGDPHLESYCAAFLDEGFVTQYERPELRCARERTATGQPVG